MGQTDTLGRRGTTVTKTDKVTYVQYHQTVVVEFNEHVIVLRTGGWNTVTTKARMNQASSQFDLDYHVYVSKGIWYVTFRGVTTLFPDDGVCRLAR